MKGNGEIRNALKKNYKIDKSISLTNGLATRQKIEDSFKRFHPDGDLPLSSDDRLIVIFSGHGEKDKAGHTYWLPYNARPDDDTFWYKHDKVVDHFRLIEAGHILILSDSCFSGGLHKTRKVKNKNKSGLQTLIDNQSRYIFSSGAEELVEDDSGSGISSFAEAIVYHLKNNQDEYFRFDSVSDEIKKYIREKTSQKASYREVLISPCNGGELILVSSKKDYVSSEDKKLSNSKTREHLLSVKPLTSSYKPEHKDDFDVELKLTEKGSSQQYKKLSNKIALFIGFMLLIPIFMFLTHALQGRFDISEVLSSPKKRSEINDIVSVKKKDTKPVVDLASEIEHENFSKALISHQTPLPNEDLKILQKTLKRNGFYLGAVDGLYGPATKRASSHFQKLTNLPIPDSYSSAAEIVEKNGITTEMEGLIKEFYNQGDLNSSEVISKVKIEEILSQYKTAGIVAYDSDYFWAASDISRYAIFSEMLDDADSMLEKNLEKLDIEKLLGWLLPSLCREDAQRYVDKNFQERCDEIDRELIELLGLNGSLLSTFKDNHFKTKNSGEDYEETINIRMEGLNVLIIENLGEENMRSEVVGTPKKMELYLDIYYSPMISDACERLGGARSIKYCNFPYDESHDERFILNICSEFRRIANVPKALNDLLVCDQSRLWDAGLNNILETKIGLVIPKSSYGSFKLEDVFKVPMP